jgi:hypothetical protein
MIVSKKNHKRSRSRSRSQSRSQSRSRSNNGYLKSKLVGGFLRSGTPQFSVYSGTNPLTRYAPYEVLNNTNGQKCQTGGSKKSKSNKNKRQSTIYYKYV